MKSLSLVGAVVVVAVGCGGGGSVVPGDPLPALRPESETVTIDPTVDQLALSTTLGVGVRFTADTLVAADGSAPIGSVDVKLSSYLGHADFRPSDMPGSFEGLGTDGITYALVSLGVVGVELTDSTGRPLNLLGAAKPRGLDGGTAELLVRSETAIPDGTTIPLWYLPDGEAVWNEEGVMSPISLGEDSDRPYYSGTVAHFSTWNVDAKCDSACVTVQVQDGRGRPLPGTGVMATIGTSTCEWWNWSAWARAGGAGTTGTDGSVTIRGLLGSSTLTLSATRDGETASKSLDIPGAGDSCVDGGILAFTDPGPPPSGDCTTITGVGSDGADHTFDVTRTLKGSVLGVFTCANPSFCYDNSWELNADGTGTILLQGAPPRLITWGALADPAADCAATFVDGEISPGYPKRDFTLMVRNSNGYDDPWSGWVEGELSSATLTVTPTQTGIEGTYVHDCSDCY